MEIKEVTTFIVIGLVSPDEMLNRTHMSQLEIFSDWTYYVSLFDRLTSSWSYMCFGVCVLLLKYKYI